MDMWYIAVCLVFAWSLRLDTRGSECSVIYSNMNFIFVSVLGLRRVNMSLCIGLDLGVYGLCLGCVYHGILISEVWFDLACVVLLY